MNKASKGLASAHGFEWMDINAPKWRHTLRDSIHPSKETTVPFMEMVVARVEAARYSPH